MKLALIHFNHTDSKNLTSWPDLRTAKWQPNYGDMLVCASILKQIEFVESVRYGFGSRATQDCDRAIIRGSTYLHNQFNFDEANQTIDSLQSPVSIVGLGAQSPAQDVKFLDGNSGARKFISRLNEKSASISVRGSFSANVVERLGGKNIRVTGCPSLFYSAHCPKIRLSEMLSRKERSLGVSIHTGLQESIFCRDPVRARTMHAQAISFALKNAANVSLFEQGVLREYNVADKRLDFSERLSSAKKILETIGGHGLLTEYDLISRMVSVCNIEEWLSKARDLDAIIGFRFHGNMVALLQGSPCYYYVYDSRIKEFCDAYGLPQHPIEKEWVDPVTAMLDHDWSLTNKRITNCYTELKSFYCENGFNHRLI